jgi:hypothetical protein
MKKRNYHCCFRVMYSNPGLCGNLPDICAAGQFVLIGTGDVQPVSGGGAGCNVTNDRGPGDSHHPHGPVIDEQGKAAHSIMNQRCMPSLSWK